MLAGHRGTQNTYSVGGQPIIGATAGAVSAHYLLPLGYEPHDAGFGITLGL